MLYLYHQRDTEVERRQDIKREALFKILETMARKVLERGDFIKVEVAVGKYTDIAEDITVDLIEDGADTIARGFADEIPDETLDIIEEIKLVDNAGYYVIHIKTK